MLMTKMAPLTVVLCVAVALQPMLAASVQKDDRGERSLSAWRRHDGFNPILLLLLRILKRYKQRVHKGRGGFLVVPRKGRGFETGEEESERGRETALDPINLQVNPDRVCAEVLRNGPLNEGLPFRLIDRQFQTADENGDGALEKTEVKTFLDKLLALKFCMDRTV